MKVHLRQRKLKSKGSGKSRFSLYLDIYYAKRKRKKEFLGIYLESNEDKTYHTELAKLNGATEEEIEDALHFTKSSAGWSAYVNGLQLDFDEFAKETDQVCEHVRSTMVSV